MRGLPILALIILTSFIVTPALSGASSTCTKLVVNGQMTLKPDGPKQTAQACCKICRKGKACGNSCISRAKTCRKPPGCACEAR